MEGPAAASFPWKEGHYLGEGSIPALEITGDQGMMKAASHMKITFIHGDFGEADPEVAKVSGGTKYTVQTPRAENAKINVTDEPYFGTQIVCNYLPFSKAAKGAQGGPQQYATFERKHSPTEK